MEEQQLRRLYKEVPYDFLCHIWEDLIRECPDIGARYSLSSVRVSIDGSNQAIISYHEESGCPTLLDEYPQIRIDDVVGNSKWEESQED